jgi:hypothetical protein
MKCIGFFFSGSAHRHLLPLKTITKPFGNRSTKHDYLSYLYIHSTFQLYQNIVWVIEGKANCGLPTKSLEPAIRVLKVE